MQIREAKVYHFGKLEKCEFAFAPGINVIYGENEAGKSTLHTFLTAMLFGMEKGRGRKDDYQRYEPWHAPSYYSGAIRFQVDEKPFYLERNFYHKEKREILRNEADGEEMSVAYGDLAMLLGGIDKETFGNTYDIPQSGAVTGKELTSMLSEYLSDAAESGDRSIHVARAKDLLTTKRKVLNADLKKMQEEKQGRKQMLLMEQELLDRDSMGLRENIKKAKEQLAQAEISYRKVLDMGKQACVQQNVMGTVVERECRGETSIGQKRQRGAVAAGGILAIVALVGMLWSWSGAVAKGGFETQFWILQSILGIVLLGGCFGLVKGMLGLNKKRGASNASQGTEPSGVINPELEEAGRTERDAVAEALGAEQSQVAQMLAMLSDALDEKETRLYNLKEELQALELPDGRERELSQDIQALELATEEIERLAREFCEEIEDSLNEEVSRYVSAITEEKYDSVRVDEKGELRVLTDGKEILPDALSRGTLEQFHLALRLAVGNIVMKEDTMPIFLDETFAMYDDRRLEQALKVLTGMNRQVLIFTCQKREMDVLEGLGIPYHRIRMTEA